MSDLEKMRDYIKNKDLDNIVKLLEEPSSDKAFVNSSYDILLSEEPLSNPADFLTLTHHFIDYGLDANFKPEGQGASFFQRVIILIFRVYLEESNYKSLVDPKIQRAIATILNIAEPGFLREAEEKYREYNQIDSSVELTQDQKTEAENKARQAALETAVGIGTQKAVEDNLGNYANLITLLVTTYPSPKELLNNRADDGYTPFLTAISLYKQKTHMKSFEEFVVSPSYVMIELIMELIQQGADLELPVQGKNRETGMSAIHIAAQKPSTSRTLLQALMHETSIDLNKLSEEGLTPLMYAVRPIVDGAVRSEMAGSNVAFLLSKNADVNITAPKFNNRNVLQMACLERHSLFETIEVIVSGGKGEQETILDHQDTYGMTALMLSVQIGDTNPRERALKIREIIFGGADIYLKNNVGKDVFNMMEEIRRKFSERVAKLMRDKTITEDKLGRLYAQRTRIEQMGLEDEDSDLDPDILQSMYDQIEQETGLKKEEQITAGRIYGLYFINNKIGDMLDQPNINIKEGPSFLKFDFDDKIPDDFTYDTKITDALISGDTKTLREWLYEPIGNVIFTDEKMENYAVLPQKDILKIIREAEQLVVRCDKSKLSPGALNITEDMVFMNYGIYLKTNALGLVGGPAEGTLIHIKEIYSKIIDPAAYKDLVFVVLRHDDHPLSPLVSLSSLNVGNGLNINDRQINVVSSDHCQPETGGVKGSLQPMKVRPSDLTQEMKRVKVSDDAGGKTKGGKRRRKSRKARKHRKTKKRGKYKKTKKRK